jgi:type III restriction enzyme
MTENLIIKSEALEPLFETWEEPNRHRVNASKGEGSEIRQGRRPTNRIIVQNLRAEVKQWRENYYFQASDTTRQLLAHWFGRDHSITTPAGLSPFAPRKKLCFAPLREI